MTQEIITEFLYSNETTLPFLLIVFATAFILGAIHALGPGHGKSLMAAYLIGSRGRIRDTLVLALTLTISHVFSVVILGIAIIVVFSLGLSCVLITLGIIMLKASHLIKGRLGGNKIRLLPVAGSIIIFGVGIYIIIRAYLAFS
jgi:ABC-type nickel/cobalt efflux system permease component RcnA